MSLPVLIHAMHIPFTVITKLFNRFCHCCKKSQDHRHRVSRKLPGWCDEWRKHWCHQYKDRQMSHQMWLESDLTLQKRQKRHSGLTRLSHDRGSGQVTDGVSRFMNKLNIVKSINTTRARKVLLVGLEGLYRWILKSPKNQDHIWMSDKYKIKQ